MKEYQSRRGKKKKMSQCYVTSEPSRNKETQKQNDEDVGEKRPAIPPVVCKRDASMTADDLLEVGRVRDREIPNGENVCGVGGGEHALRLHPSMVCDDHIDLVGKAIMVTHGGRVNRCVLHEIPHPA